MKKDASSEIKYIRQQAERLLDKDMPSVVAPITEYEFHKLVHELKVHQIELELQNEELILAKEQAAIASDKYIELYDFAPSGYYTLSRKGEIIQLNLLGAKMLGKERPQLKELLFQAFVSDESKPLFWQFLKKTFDSSILETCDVDLSINGSLPMHVHLTGHTIENGEQCLITVVDITERTKAEKELLRKSEHRYRLLIETVNEGISVAQNGYLKFVNPMMQTITGFTQEELLTLPFLSFVYPEDQDIVISNHLKRQRGEPFSSKYQFRIVKKDGSLRIIEMNGVVKEWEGQPATLNIFADITEREHAEEEIKRKNEQLQKLNAEKDKFFSIIAHDLRGPFSSFLGLTEIMAGDLNSLTMEEIQEYSLTLRKSATNLYSLLENLLLWSRMQQGSIPFNPQSWLMFQIVEEFLTMESANNKGITIVYEIPDQIAVWADKNMLETIIRNLISNAVKFTPKGGKISISAKVLHDQSIEISVKDTGIGMSPSMVGDLFKLGVQTNRKGTEGEPSSGLGMLLCKEFVEKHNGCIWVESEEGKGSEFKFTLPMGNGSQSD